MNNQLRLATLPVAPIEAFSIIRPPRRGLTTRTRVEVEVEAAATTGDRPSHRSIPVPTLACSTRISPFLRLSTSQTLPTVTAPTLIPPRRPNLDQPSAVRLRNHSLLPSRVSSFLPFLRHPARAQATPTCKPSLLPPLTDRTPLGSRPRSTSRLRTRTISTHHPAHSVPDLPSPAMVPYDRLKCLRILIRTGSIRTRLRS